MSGKGDGPAERHKMLCAHEMCLNDSWLIYADGTYECAKCGHVQPRVVRMPWDIGRPDEEIRCRPMT